MRIRLIRFVINMIDDYDIECKIYNPTQARLRCGLDRSGTKLEKTSLSTDGRAAPAYGYVILHNIYCKEMEFRNYLAYSAIRKERKSHDKDNQNDRGTGNCKISG